MTCFLKTLRSCVMLLVLMSVLLGGVYPMLVTAISQTVFPHTANGSQVLRDGKVIGSTLLGQSFENEWYFWGRPSGVKHGDGVLQSGASNLAPTSKTLLDNTLQQAQLLQSKDPENKKRVPIDLISSSASGLDPDISVEAAQYQVHRVANARHISEDRLNKLIAQHQQTFGANKLAVEPYVNVLELNLALDELAKKQP